MGNSPNELLKRTPLYKEHVAAGGKMVPFAGWEMPVQYPAGVVEEHLTVRSKVGLFDVSHMGEITVTGKDALQFLDFVTCNAVSQIKIGQAQYSALPNERGGIVDDIIIYRKGENDFFLCVNASNTDIDFAWLKQHVRGDVELKNVSESYAQIAVQGPKSFDLLAAVFGEDFRERIKPFWFCDSNFNTNSSTYPVMVARTGYTGEDGVEVFISPEGAAPLWNALLDKGRTFGVLPCGLGARDSLRLEACYPLHGHELSVDITAIESGLGWIVKPEKKGDFIGRSILEREKAEGGGKRKLVGFFVEDQGIVREQTPIFASAGGGAADGNTPIGFVTSGTKTPTVGKSTGKALGLAFVQREYSDLGTALFAEVRGRRLKVTLVSTPFYKRER